MAGLCVPGNNCPILSSNGLWWCEEGGDEYSQHYYDADTTQILSGYFSLDFISQLLPGLLHIKERLRKLFVSMQIFIYKNTVLNRRVVLTATSKNSILAQKTSLV